MKCKYILLIFSILVLCGCRATYKLEIKNGVFKENISINDLNDSNLSYFNDNKFYAVMNGASSFIEYKKKIKNNSVNFTHNYNNTDYSFSTALKTCFAAYNVIDEKGYYLISTSKGIKCAVEEDRNLLENIDIIIKTNHVVKDNNADEVKKHEYIWHFNKDNYNDGNIYLKIQKNKYVSNYNNEDTILIIILCSLSIVIIFGVLIILKKVKKAQKV